MTLQEKLTELRDSAKARIPAETREIMRQATEQLENSGILDRVLSRGERFPSFCLADDKQTDVDSRQLLERGPLVVTFYRGVW
jgi:hypothetical protein